MWPPSDGATAAPACRDRRSPLRLDALLDGYEDALARLRHAKAVPSEDSTEAVERIDDLSEQLRELVRERERRLIVR